MLLTYLLTYIQRVVTIKDLKLIHTKKIHSNKLNHILLQIYKINLIRHHSLDQELLGSTPVLASFVSQYFLGSVDYNPH